MERYDCPGCGEKNLSWSSRARAYVCMTTGCGTSVLPPHDEGLTDRELSSLLSTRRIVVLPKALAAAKPAQPRVQNGAR